VGPNLDLDRGIRSKEELDSWMQRCPIQKVRDRLMMCGGVPDSFFENVEKEVAVEIEEALAYAKAEARPQASTLLQNIFVEPGDVRDEESCHE
jgi:pyruvate dehydrogenase E1 component alpha subunit